MKATEQPANVQAKSLGSPLAAQDATSISDKGSVDIKGSSTTVDGKAVKKNPEQTTTQSKQPPENQSLQVQFDDIPQKESNKGDQPLLPKKSPTSKEDDAKHIEEDDSGFCRCCQTTCCGREMTRAERLRRQRCKAKCSRCCKKTVAFFISHIMLCALVGAYSIMGGFLFSYLEGPAELRERAIVSLKRDQSIGLLWNMTQELNVLYEKNWTEIADLILKDFQDEVVKAVREKGWDGRDETDTDVKWSFNGALLYSITVITTIGYGHIAPRTDEGRLVTMAYALLGIPLTLLCLSNIGSSCADCFRFLYKHSCDGVYYLFCPAKHEKRKFVSPKPAFKSKTPSKSSKSTSPSKSPPKTLKSKKMETNIVTAEAGTSRKDIDFISEEPSDKEEEEVRVPVFVSLLIIAAYVFGGAVLFSLWEKDWNYLIGAYFCFITLSTIGFGDFVFGVGTDFDNNEKLVVCALYLVMGLSIIAMCFSLMQEEVKAKCRDLGEYLGILKKHKKRRN